MHMDFKTIFWSFNFLDFFLNEICEKSKEIYAPAKTQCEQCILIFDINKDTSEDYMS